MSLFRIPGASSVAPSRLSTSEPIVAPATTATSADAGNQADPTASAAEEEGAGDARGGAFERHRARGARRRPAESRSRGTCAVPTPCRSRWRWCRSRPRPARRRRPAARVAVATVDTDSSAAAVGEAGIGDGVAGAAASAALLGDPEQRLAPQTEPRADRRRQERRQQQRPARPAGRHGDGDADERAGHGARSLSPCAPDNQATATATFAAVARTIDWPPAQIAGRTRSLANERQRPEHAGGRRRDREVVVEPDRGSFRRTRRRAPRREAREREPHVGRRRHVRPAPPGERARRAMPPQRKNASDAGEGLLAVPRDAPAAEPRPGDRRHPVADGQDGPGGGGDVEPVTGRPGRAAAPTAG